MKKLAVLIAVVIVFILGVSLKDYIFSASSAAAPKCLEYIGSTIAESNGATAISGSVKNNCDQKFRTVQINFTLEPSGKAAAYGQDLLPGQTWDFRTLPVPKDSTYRFSDISAY